MVFFLGETSVHQGTSANDLFFI